MHFKPQPIVKFEALGTSRQRKDSTDTIFLHSKQTKYFRPSVSFSDSEDYEMSQSKLL